MFKIRSRFDVPLRQSSHIPNVVNVLCYDEKSKRMEVVGRKDRIAEADVFREVCSISNKLSRFSNGDVSALNSVKGVYTDISGIPTDYNTMHNVVRSAMVDSLEHGFKSIPEYIQSLISFDDDSSNPIDPNPTAPKEVKTNES